MKHLLPSAKMFFFSRISLYFFSLVILLYAISGFMMHVSVVSDVLFSSIDIQIKLVHAQSELTRLIVSCMFFGMLLLLRSPLNKKDVAFNTTCYRYGLAFLYSSLFLITMYFVISIEPPVLPHFPTSLSHRAFFWPVISIFYIFTSVSFVYRSLQD